MTDTLGCGVLLFLLLLNRTVLLVLVTAFVLIVERGEDAAFRRVQLYMTLDCNAVRIGAFDFERVLETVKLVHFLYYSRDLQ